MTFGTLNIHEIEQEYSAEDYNERNWMFRNGTLFVPHQTITLPPWFKHISLTNNLTIGGAALRVRTGVTSRLVLLQSLENSPLEINGWLSVSGAPITNLVGGPTSVGAGYYCIDTKNLTSLEGAPTFIGSEDSFHIINAGITDLRGLENTILHKAELRITNCPLTSVEGFPETFTGRLIIDGKENIWKMFREVWDGELHLINSMGETMDDQKAFDEPGFNWKDFWEGDWEDAW